MKRPCVYMLASQKRGTIYIGVTSDLVGRVWDHQQGAVPGFTKTYNVKRLVWFEEHETMISAIAREKAMKRYKRAWKIKLIEEHNPKWRELRADTGEFL